MPALALCICAQAPGIAQTPAASPLSAEIDRRIEAALPRVVAWRRDIHQHPELGNREVRTAKLVADHLTRLGMDVRTQVAHTGVVGLLKGGRPGPVVALRADMDALPVTEQAAVPFASKVRTTYNGQDVGVMHACGHDNHVAILMGVAEALAGLKDQLPGSVKFTFQPAEEGPPAGEEGGAALMIKQGVLENPKPEAIFGLHVFPVPVGTVGYRSGGFLASADTFTIKVQGRQTHGAMPWAGVDPIVVASQIVLALQTIVSRQVDATVTPSIITVGSIHGGLRSNIIPDSVELVGTIRTFDPNVQKQLHERIRRTAAKIAESAGATAESAIIESYPVTVNTPALVDRMVPTLKRVAGEKLTIPPPITGAEDFSNYQHHIPGLFVSLGVAPPEDPAKAAPNHSPLFFADERALPIGMRVLAHLAVDYMTGRK
jgi:amidohydrolase